jgi:hypothetical protein
MIPASSMFTFAREMDRPTFKADSTFLPRFSTINAEMKGYAFIPAGSEGQCLNTFSFTGAPDEVNYGISFKGAREGAFSLSANPDVVSWSPCGGSTAILNMNTQCSISPTDDRALIAVGEGSSGTTGNIADRINRSTASAASSPFALPLTGGGAKVLGG